MSKRCKVFGDSDENRTVSDPADDYFFLSKITDLCQLVSTQFEGRQKLRASSIKNIILVFRIVRTACQA